MSTNCYQYKRNKEIFQCKFLPRDLLSTKIKGDRNFRQKSRKLVV